MNIIKKETSEIITALENSKLFTAILLLAVAVVFFLIGFFSAPRKTRTELCKADIEQVRILSSQIEALRVSFAQQKQQIIAEQSLKSRDECNKKIAAYQKLCEELKCQVCRKSSR